MHDKGYDHALCRILLRPRHIIPRIARRGVELGEKLGRFCWVVERTLAWIHQYHRLANAAFGVAATVLSACPGTASLLGVDSVRGWLNLPAVASTAIRCGILCFAIGVASRSVRRARAASMFALLGPSAGAMTVLLAVALPAAWVWSTSVPGESTDIQEWVLLFACPSAAVTAILGSTMVLLLDRGDALSSNLDVARGVGSLLVIAALADAIMRTAGVQTFARVLVAFSIASVIAVLLATLALDGKRSLLMRIPAGLSAAAIVAALSM
ncbi:MAG: hypothetical protein JOZ69_12570, partial [Myxococcales bacterium]|nr:hypothetical protein [Myxococcales bacterium]